jgi:hypothetical protein
MVYGQAERDRAFGLFAELAERRRIQPGQKVPGELALGHELGLSRHLVRELLKRLTGDGIVQRRGRSGTFLLRPPVPGSIPVADRSLAPVVGSGRTIALMLGFPVGQSDLNVLQKHALQRGYLLQTYFSGEHAHSAREERNYLKQAAANGYAGALIHGTPLPPDNEAFFRDLSAHLRLAHIGYHAEGLPAQSFFLPDLGLAGAICAAHLAGRRCRHVTLFTTLPSAHHFTMLILRGLRTACEGIGMNLAVVDRDEGDVIRHLSGIPRSEEHGLAFCFWPDNADARAALIERAASQPCAVIVEHSAVSIPSAIFPCIFDWRQTVTEALDWVMADTPAVRHRLYPPQVPRPVAASRSSALQAGAAYQGFAGREAQAIPAMDQGYSGTQGSPPDAHTT